MKRAGVWWGGVRDSLWFLPGVMTVLAAVLAWAAVEVDKAFLTAGRSDYYLAFGGGVEGARGVLTAIASTMITVTGVVFSVTIVALQLASSQFTPRVLRNFIANRANQVVLGVFIGTFTYTLLVLRTVRSAADDGAPFVPSIAVGLAILLALLSVGFLIFFVHHAARSIQVTVVLDRATKDTLRLVDNLFPEPIGEPTSEPADSAPVGEEAVVVARQSGYLQAVDGEALLMLAGRRRLVVRMVPRIGEFVLPGAPLATLWPADLAEDEAADGIREAFVIGSERTLDQDLELGLQQLADIVLRALSPSTNDPTTAITGIDRITQVLVTLGNRAQPARVRTDERGAVRFIGQGSDFERAVGVAVDQIARHSADMPSVASHLAVSLERAAALVPVERRPPLARRATELRRGRRALPPSRDGAAWTALDDRTRVG